MAESRLGAPLGLARAPAAESIAFRFAAPAAKMVGSAVRVTKERTRAEV